MSNLEYLLDPAIHVDVRVVEDLTEAQDEQKEIELCGKHACSV